MDGMQIPLHRDIVSYNLEAGFCSTELTLSSYRTSIGLWKDMGIIWGDGVCPPPHDAAMRPPVEAVDQFVQDSRESTTKR